MAAKLRSKIFLSFCFIIVLLGTLFGIFGYFVLRNNVVNRAQRRVQSDLRAARAVFYGEIDELGRAFTLIDRIDNPASLKAKLGLDYLFILENGAADSAQKRGPIVARAFGGNATGGVRLLDSAELCRIGVDIYNRCRIPVRFTPRALPTNKKLVSHGMAVEYAMPFADAYGNVRRVIYGGKIINNNLKLIERIHSIVYENRLYKSKPVGTVTIFLDDVRIATNVLDKNGMPAIGTRISEAVYTRVVKEGVLWLDRAFVVTDWYLTAYEPIHDVNGAIVGILYVGTLEKPFVDMLRTAMMIFLALMAGGIAVAVVLSIILAGAISSPMSGLMKAVNMLARGDLGHRVQTVGTITEINRLAESFNEMADRLAERDHNLRSANEGLAAANKRYLDLVGMVSHELKGILASAVMSAYSVRDGYLGEINPAQRKALDSVARNLEYFDMTVKNFLNLSRIEKGELGLNISEFLLKENVVDSSIEMFTRQAEAKRMKIENVVPAGIKLRADSSLVHMVMNNLIGNAVKYGAERGIISISALQEKDAVTVSVYNDGRPLTVQDQQKLFKRFSRLASPETQAARGTGLGLFTSKEIIEAHGGSICAQAREKGNAFMFSLPKRPAT